jgi:ketosteroid isomerase-like protein
VGDLERILAMYERAAADPLALASVLDDGVAWEVDGMGMFDLHDSEGPAGVLDFFRRWTGAFAQWGFEVLEAFAESDRVVAHIRQWGIGKGSGARVENEFWQIWHMRDGKAVRVTHSSDRP